MNNTERLKRIVQFHKILNSAEKRTLELYLTAFYDDFSSIGSVYKRIYDQITSSNLEEGLDVKDLNLKTQSEDAIRKNLERYEEKLLEAASLEVNVKRSNSFDPCDRDSLVLISQIKYYKLLTLMDFPTESLRHLRKAYKIARRIESFDLLLYVLYQIADIATFRNIDLKSLNVDREIDKFEKVRATYNNTNRIKQSIFRMYLIDSPNKDQVEKLHLMMGDIRTISKSDDLPPSTQRNIYYSMLLYFDKFKDYDECLKVCHNLKELVENSYSIRKKRELSSININLILFNILEFHFAEAQELVNATLKEDGLNDINRSYLLVLAIRNNLNLGNYNDARHYLEEASNYEKFSSVYKEQLSMCNAIDNYYRKNYKKALEYLTAMKQLKKDKAGWNFYSRFMIVLCYGMSKNTDTALNEFENFKRYLHSKKITERQKRQITNLSKFIMGSSKKDAYSFSGIWDPSSSEIVDFDGFFINHNEGG